MLNEKASFLETTKEQKEKIDKIRIAFSNMYDTVDNLCKNSREKSLVMTKLEEAQFWAIKGISREEE